MHAARDHQTRVSFAEPRFNPIVIPQSQSLVLGPDSGSRVANINTAKTSLESVLLVDELSFTKTHSLLRRSISLLKRISYFTPATTVCEGSCAVRLFPPVSLKRFDGFGGLNTINYIYPSYILIRCQSLARVPYSRLLYFFSHSPSQSTEPHLGKPLPS